MKSNIQAEHSKTGGVKKEKVPINIVNHNDPNSNDQERPIPYEPNKLNPKVFENKRTGSQDELLSSRVYKNV